MLRLRSMQTWKVMEHAACAQHNILTHIVSKLTQKTWFLDAVFILKVWRLEFSLTFLCDFSNQFSSQQSILQNSHSKSFIWRTQVNDVVIACWFGKRPSNKMALYSLLETKPFHFSTKPLPFHLSSLTRVGNGCYVLHNIFTGLSFPSPTFT